MAATLGDAPKPDDAESPYRPLGHARHSPDWLDEEQVAADQRRRLHGAMIELVAERGYAEASTRELARLARISKQDMYKRFPSKESYFLATYDMIVARAIERVGDAYAGARDWRQRLRRAFQALAEEVVEQPKAARLALAEVLGAGPAGLERLDATRSIFEAMVGASFAESPDAPPLPPLVVKGVVRGVERIVRQRLLKGRERELPELADQLLEWALSYHSPVVTQLAARPRVLAPAQRGPLRQRTKDERAQLLRIAAQLAAAGGWEQLTPAHIASYAEAEPQRVRELCGENPRRCFLNALQLLSMEALICALQAARRSSTPPDGVHLGIVALLDHVERDRALCRLAFVEAFKLGPSASQRREALLSSYTSALYEAVPEDRRPAPLAADAIVGAVWGILHCHVTHARTHTLPDVADEVSYLALAPAVGPEDAVAAIRRANDSIQVAHAR